MTSILETLLISLILLNIKVYFYFNSKSQVITQIVLST